MTFAHIGGRDVRKREIQTVLLSLEGATATTIDGKYVTVRTALSALRSIRRLPRQD